MESNHSITGNSFIEGWAWWALRSYSIEQVCNRFGCLISYAQEDWLAFLADDLRLLTKTSTFILSHALLLQPERKIQTAEADARYAIVRGESIEHPDSEWSHLRQIERQIEITTSDEIDGCFEVTVDTILNHFF